MNASAPPGFNPQRMSRLIESAVERCNLRLDGLCVLTEAATGAYAVTPVLAAAAGAEVYAFTRASRHGSIEEVRGATADLAARCGCAHRLQVIEQATTEVISRADIVTNSGHLRPIGADTIAAMKPTAVIPLMYESWELRASDLDLASCRRRAIAVAGTNERHPAVGVFSFLGTMAVKLLLDAGVAVYGSRILVLCDNPFSGFLQHGLEAAGAELLFADRLGTEPCGLDAVLVAMHPRAEPSFSARDAERLARQSPGAVVADFWGGIDRGALGASGVPFWPLGEVTPGHMGILPSAIGPEPVVRLQCGGLKVGEVMARASARGEEPVQAAVDSGFGQAIGEEILC